MPMRASIEPPSPLFPPSSCMGIGLVAWSGHRALYFCPCLQWRLPHSGWPTLFEGPFKQSLERTKLCGQAIARLTTASRGLALSEGSQSFRDFPDL
jgi:hypothetical protein